MSILKSVATKMLSEIGFRIQIEDTKVMLSDGKKRKVVQYAVPALDFERVVYVEPQHRAWVIEDNRVDSWAQLAAMTEGSWGIPSNFGAHAVVVGMVLEIEKAAQMSFLESLPRNDLLLGHALACRSWMLEILPASVAGIGAKEAIALAGIHADALFMPFLQEISRRGVIL